MAVLSSFRDPCAKIVKTTAFLSPGISSCQDIKAVNNGYDANHISIHPRDTLNFSYDNKVLHMQVFTNRHAEEFVFNMNENYVFEIDTIPFDGLCLTSAERTSVVVTAERRLSGDPYEYAKLVGISPAELFTFGTKDEDYYCSQIQG